MRVLRLTLRVALDPESVPLVTLRVLRLTLTLRVFPECVPLDPESVPLDPESVALDPESVPLDPECVPLRNANNNEKQITVNLRAEAGNPYIPDTETPTRHRHDKNRANENLTF